MLYKKINVLFQGSRNVSGSFKMGDVMRHFPSKRIPGQAVREKNVKTFNILSYVL